MRSRQRRVAPTEVGAINLGPVTETWRAPARRSGVSTTCGGDWHRYASAAPKGSSSGRGSAPKECLFARAGGRRPSVPEITYGRSRVKHHESERQGTEHDFAVVARRVVEQAIGEKLDGSPLDDPDAGTNLAAVALGKLGGRMAARRGPTRSPRPSVLQLRRAPLRLDGRRYRPIKQRVMFVNG
jgi:hypothetical protein